MTKFCVCRWIATGNEIWVVYCDSETEKVSGVPSLNFPHVWKFKAMKSAGKVMLTIFWDAHGIIHKKYIAWGAVPQSIRILTVPHYRNRRTEFEGFSPLFCYITTTRALVVILKQMPRSSAQVFLNYSASPLHPFFDILDLCLFPWMKSDTKGNHFTADDEIQLFAHKWLKSKEEFLLTVLKKLVLRLQKCIDLDGDYIKKWCNFIWYTFFYTF